MSFAESRIVRSTVLSEDVLERIKATELSARKACERILGNQHSKPVRLTVRRPSYLSGHESIPIQDCGRGTREGGQVRGLGKDIHSQIGRTIIVKV